MISSTAGEKKGKTTGESGQKGSDGSAELTFSAYLSAPGFESLIFKKNLSEFTNQNDSFSQFVQASFYPLAEASERSLHTADQAIYEKYQPSWLALIRMFSNIRFQKNKVTRECA